MGAGENRFAPELNEKEVLELLKTQHDGVQRKPQSMA